MFYSERFVMTFPAIFDVITDNCKNLILPVGFKMREDIITFFADILDLPEKHPVRLEGICANAEQKTVSFFDQNRRFSQIS